MPLRRLPRLAAAAILAGVAGSSPGHAAVPPPTSATSADSLSAVLTDTRVERLTGGVVVVCPEPYTPPITVTAPRYGGTYSRAVYVYAPSESGRLVRRVTIHHEPEARAEAERSARLCARLLRLHRERFGRDTRFPREVPEVHLWLTPERPSDARLGGETRGSDVYVFAANIPRTHLEWVRTVSHEWGHLTLPGARGFLEPESDAAGFLGERLYLKWLREDTQAVTAAGTPLPDDGTAAADLDMYHARQIAPLIVRWEKGGPTASLLSGTDTAAMDYYIGAVLATDNAFGSQVTGKALFSVADVRPRDFLEALEDRLTRAPGVIAVRLPAWVPLAKTHYRILPAPNGGMGSIALADRPPVSLQKGPADLSVLLAGWKWVRAVSGDLRSIVLQPSRTQEASE